MSIDKLKIRENVRKRVIVAAAIDPLTQFQEENKDFNPQGLDFWIAEYCIGGEEIMITSRRSRISSFIIQYDLYAPLNSGTEKLDRAVADISTAFDLSDPSKSSIEVPGYSINVVYIKIENKAEKDWQRETIVFSLDVVKS